MKSILALVLIGVSTIAIQAANAADDATACYGFRSQDASSTRPPSQLTPLDQRLQTWCYKQVTSPRRATLIYLADVPELRPELAVLVDEGGTITHASLLKGKTTINKIQGTRFNPLGVPLVAPTNGIVRPVKTDAAFTASVDKVLEYLMNGKGSYYSMRVRPGNFSATAVTANQVPWRGFWWSFAGGALHSGPDSPLAKYDRFVSARTGQPSLAQIWESVHHAPDGNPWSGHCNGWAASSIMRPEPTAPITDPVSGVTFSVGDQKGILASQDFCAVTAFFGNRNNGWRGDDARDLYPGDFHNVVLYYIGQLRKPIAMDRHSSPAVDNHSASSYTMDIQREGDHFSVKTTLTMHKYDAGPNKPPGTAPEYKREFKYLLWLGPRGEVVKSQWLNENPDFIWVPLSPFECPDGNPYVQEQWVKQIFGW